MAKRQKVAEPKPIQFTSLNEVDNALFDISQIDAQISLVENQYNETEQQLRNEVTAKTAPMREQKVLIENSIKKYCEENREEFGKKKSVELKHGAVFFRQTPPKVSTLKGITIKAAIGLIEKSVSWATSFLRTKIEMDKDAILAMQKAGEIADAELATMGLEITQDEIFQYEIKNAIEVE